MLKSVPRRIPFLRIALSCGGLPAFAEGMPEVLTVEPPGWWAAHTINPVRLLVRGRNAFAAVRRTAGEQRMCAWTRDWIRPRREHAAVRRGELIDLAVDDDSYVYARKLGAEILIIGINRAGAAHAVTIPAADLELTDGARGGGLQACY